MLADLTMKTRLLVMILTGGVALAQTFSAGNIVVTRSVYTGDASVLAAGQALPPVCPTTAACGTGKASDSGVYPNLNNSNNVWNNNKVDGSFGITSPIFIDQMTPTGTLVNTLAVPPNLLTTSFSSKSELAINLSLDGSVLTLMGYVAPPNTIDVSNSNTPLVYDPTNPAGGSYYRAVLQIGANGALQVTPTNSYSGNNGRAVVLANGFYYMVGNSNNGGGTPANVIASTGVQMATPGQTAGTPAVEIGNFSITQVTNPTTMLPYAADKAGKDNNFRGLAVFQSSLYMTKGSGSNGINTVYQVGNGALPTLANAAATPINVLPGFPTALAKTTTASSLFPFGIWFANATTLYVADEGDGVVADAATAPNAGLQKWILVNGTWQMAYVMQKGLNLGVPYSVPNYPTALNPSTDGLRNLCGKVNSDGTVTIWAITSTVSANGDQGADPNKLVSIVDTLANTSPTNAANESFTTVRTANAGEVLRGVSLTPVASTAMPNVPLIESVANPGATAIAPGSLAVANGQNLVPGYPGPIFGLLPIVFEGTSVTILDSAGATWPAPLFYVAPNEVDFEVPPGVAAGLAKVTVSSNGLSQTASNVQIAKVTPGIFTLNASGLASAYAIRVSANGTSTVETVYSINTAGAVLANPVNLGAATDQVTLALFGTGLASVGTANVTATVNGVKATVTYAGPQGGEPGFDQVNLILPTSLAGAGNVNVQITAAGVAANPVQVTIQ
jgi:uncharacterized protein (TIGR03437 family)